eukprot:SAG31_NODE_480_length_15108_cov_56.073423_14_plen_98_part_00
MVSPQYHAYVARAQKPVETHGLRQYSPAVVEDPREMHDLSAAMPQKVKELQQRLVYWNTTTVGSIHVRPGDPSGNAYANATDCWSPWEGKKPDMLPL